MAADHGPELPTSAERYAMRHGHPATRRPLRTSGRPTQAAASYNELADRYRRALDLVDRAWARLTLTEPGSQRSARLVEIHDAAQRKAAALRREVLNHPDAPPQG